MLGLQILDDLINNAGESDSKKETDLASDDNLAVFLEKNDDKNDGGDDETPNLSVDGNPIESENTDDMSNVGSVKIPLAFIDETVPIN